MAINIREKCIELNEMMQTLHIRLDIFEKLELINVGSIPGDGTGETLDETISKVIENFSNVLNTIVDRVV